MSDRPESEKIDLLDKRIEQAQAGAKPQVKEDGAAIVAANRVVTEFIGSVVGGGVLGWFADHVLGTFPWVMVGGVIAGFGVGVSRVWHRL